MTAHQQTVYSLSCDGCNEDLVDAEYGSQLVDNDPERIRRVADDMEWSRDGDNDLCPTCTCARDGHERRVSENGTYAYCARCDTTLLEAQTAEPKAAYL